MRPATTILMCLVLAVPAPALAGKARPVAPTAPETAPVAPAPDDPRPGPEHARLAALAGRWTSTYHVTPAPGARVLEFPGSAELRVTLGGLWLEGDTELSLGEPKIRGRLMYGFDRFKQRYVFLFVQERDTQPLFGYGEPDASGTTITFTVPMDVPMIGRRGVPMRTVLDLTAPDRFSFAMNAPLPEGGEYQPLRIDYERAK